ncbi:hypothetical protein ACWDRB_46870 [Nonomuraea sp. NPDC003707]
MTFAPPTRNRVDVAADACRRLATHLDLPAHQLGETCLAQGERERLAAALEAIEMAVAKVAAIAGMGMVSHDDDHGC